MMPKGNGSEKSFTVNKKRSSRKTISHSAGRPLRPAVKPEALTVDQHFGDYFRAKSGEVKETTLANYKETYRSAIKPHLGHIKLKDLDYRRINALYEAMAERGLTRTISLTSFLLRSALEDAARKGLVPVNQAKLAPAVRRKRKRPGSWTSKR